MTVFRLALLGLAMVMMACDPATEVPMDEDAIQREYVPVASAKGQGIERLRLDADPREARERLIRRVAEMEPSLNDSETLASFRGENPNVIGAVPRRMAHLAPLIARIYELLDREREMYPDRFRPKLP